MVQDFFHQPYESIIIINYDSWWIINDKLTLYENLLNSNMNMIEKTDSSKTVECRMSQNQALWN